MAREYAQKKIKEALKITRGNFSRARQQLILWAMDDTKLLQELAGPHLKGIVGHAINHLINQETKPKEPRVPEPVIEQDAGDNAFGLEILKTIAGGSASQFGLDNTMPVSRRGPASQRHIDAIKQMIDKDNKSE